jgi:hypothetical protein
LAPVAHTLEQAHRLIEAVEGERVRRQALMAGAGVADWRDLPEDERLPLLLLVVDEAADFARTPAMQTLVEVARKGRAFGVSIVLGTQSPSSKVIDPQVRANLPTAIAFQTRTDVESRVILGCKGAEDLDRPGLALAFLDGQWQRIQTLYAGDVAQDALDRVMPPSPHVLDELEADPVRYALDELGGAFTIGRLYEAFGDRVSKHSLTRLAQRWERRAWLTEPAHATDPRRVTPELEALALGAGGRDREIGVIGRDRDAGGVTGDVIGEELPAFLMRKYDHNGDAPGR